MTDAEMSHAMWTFTGGAILFLLQSIYSQAIRNWSSLLVGCIFGGAGSWIASQIWEGSDYIFIICGVAAVATANLIQAAFNGSKALAEEPVKVGIELAKTFFPTFGKRVGGDHNHFDPYPQDTNYPYDGGDYPHQEPGFFEPDTPRGDREDR